MEESKLLAIKSPEHFKGVYSGKENIKNIHKKIQGLKGQSSRVFNANEKNAAFKWAGVKELNNNLEVHKLLAVKSPEELKGIYCNEEIIKGILRIMPRIKSNSYRMFDFYEKEEALKWAGIDKSHYSSQTSKSNIEQQSKTDEYCVNKIVNKLTQSLSSNAEEKSDIQIIIEKYKNYGYPIVIVTLNTGKDILIQIQNIYYLNNGHTILKSEFDFDDDCNNKFYSTDYNYDTCEYKESYNKELFYDLASDICQLKATTISYLKNGIALENYDIEVEFNDVFHKFDYIYIPYTAIESIEPMGYYIPIKTKITDEDIIRDCEKLFNTNKKSSDR